METTQRTVTLEKLTQIKEILFNNDFNQITPFIKILKNITSICVNHNPAILS